MRLKVTLSNSRLIFSKFIKENFTKPQATSNITNRPRIDFIDLAKGVCILLVVLLHCGLSTETPALRAMRMPLYFILSGLFFKDYGGLLAFLRRKINKILIPYIFFATLPMVWIAIFSRDTFIEELLKPIFIPEMHNNPVWFLICLFWVNIIYCIISLNIKKLRIRVIAVLLIGFAGFLSDINKIYLPLFLCSAFSGLPYFFIGTLIRSFPILYNNEQKNICFVLGISLMVMIVAYCIWAGTPYIEFRTNSYSGNIITIYLVSIGMVFGLLMVCKLITWLPIISYIGKFSIIVLGLHALFLDYAYILINYFVGPLSKITMFLLVLGTCWLAIPICRRYIPFLTAQSDLV